MTSSPRASKAGTSAPPQALPQARQRLTQWLCQDALPLWSTTGTDWEAGGFFEQLDAQAQPIDEPRRTRVVARQVYVFATAARFGWMPDAAHALDHGLHFLAHRLRQPDGTYAAGVKPDGTIVRPQFDLYEQAFALFAMAAAQAVKPGRDELADVALETLSTLRRHWGHPRLGFHEASPPQVPLKSNPHMHMLEAALAWSDVSTGPARTLWRDLADELVTLCMQHFIDPVSDAVREYFDADWQPMPGAQGRVVEPGHQFEWAWLLTRWGVERQRPDALAAARRLVEIGEQKGVDASRNVAFNEMNDAFEVVDPVAKLWPQTERLKAWCAMAQIGHDAERAAALGRITLATDGLMQYFRATPRGLWAEQMDAQGVLKDGPSRTSSLYHIVCAIETVCVAERELSAAAAASGSSLDTVARRAAAASS